MVVSQGFIFLLVHKMISEHHDKLIATNHLKAGVATPFVGVFVSPLKEAGIKMGRKKRKK